MDKDNEQLDSIFKIGDYVKVSPRTRYYVPVGSKWVVGKIVKISKEKNNSTLYAVLYSLKDPKVRYYSCIEMKKATKKEIQWCKVVNGI